MEKVEINVLGYLTNRVVEELKKNRRQTEAIEMVARIKEVKCSEEHLAIIKEYANLK